MIASDFRQDGRGCFQVLKKSHAVSHALALGDQHMLVSKRHAFAAALLFLPFTTHQTSANDDLPALKTAAIRSLVSIQQSTIEVETASRRLETLHELQQQGLASPVEVERAKVELATNQIKLATFKSFSEYVESLSKDPDAIDSLRSNRYDGRPKLVIPIPGLSNSVGQLQLGALSVPATFDLIKLSVKIARLKQSTVADRDRLLANVLFQQELVTRLRTAATNPQELMGAETELQISNKALELAAADQLSAEHQLRLLTELQQSGADRYQLNSDIAAALQIESLRQQNVAQRLSYDAELNFRMAHLKKLTALSEAGAATQAELQYADFRVDYLIAMRAQSDRKSRRIDDEETLFANVRNTIPANDNAAVDGEVPVAFVGNSNLPALFTHLTDDYLSTAVRSARERLIDSSQIGAAENRVAAYRDYIAQLQAPETWDATFASESERAKLQLAVAAGNAAELQFHRTARQLEYAYVQTVLNAAKPATEHADDGKSETTQAAVMQSLENLFMHTADVSPLKTAATARLDYQKWKTSQTENLFSTRDAAWIELAKCHKDLAASKAAIRKLDEQAAVRQLELKRFRLIRRQSEITMGEQPQNSVVSVEE